MLFHVYDTPKPDGYFLYEPTGLYRTLLDADWIIYTLLPILLLIVVGVLMLGWRLHEIPAHKAHKKTMLQAELVSALTLLGLFMHWVWAIALFFAFVDCYFKTIVTMNVCCKQIASKFEQAFDQFLRSMLACNMQWCFSTNI